MAAVPGAAPDFTGLARSFFEKHFRSEGDFTIFFTDADLAAHGGDNSADWWYTYCRSKAGWTKPEGKTSFEFQQDVFGAAARIQVSSAGGYSYWSLSVRWEVPKQHTLPAPLNRGDRAIVLETCGWKPPDGHIAGDGSFAEADEIFLFPLSDIVSLVYDLIFEAPAIQGSASGLVLVAGATNAAKSFFARGLVWQRLDKRKDESKRLHLVTYEDPIEKPWRDPMALDKRSAFDVTQRANPSDCSSLDEALTAALRQTPEVFYIGEMRSAVEIQRAAEFGGTGHLVIGTAHSGSLIEAASKLLAADYSDPMGRRAIIGPKVLAIVHLRKYTLDFESVKPKVTAVVPTLYRRTGPGLKNLVADGLGSLLPNHPGEGETGDCGSLGRRFLAERLLPKKDDLFWNQLGAIWKGSGGGLQSPPRDVVSRTLFGLSLREDLHVG